MRIGDRIKVDNPRNINHGIVGEIVDKLDAPGPYGGGLLFQIAPDNPAMAAFWETPDKLVMVDSNLPQGELPLNKQTNHEIKCECGSDVARLGTHSDWCPKYNLPTLEDDDRLPF